MRKKGKVKKHKNENRNGFMFLLFSKEHRSHAIHMAHFVFGEWAYLAKPEVEGPSTQGKVTVK